MDYDLILKIFGSLAIAILIFAAIIYVVGVPKEYKSKAEARIAETLGENAMKDALQSQVRKIPEGDLSSLPVVGDLQQGGAKGATGVPKEVLNEGGNVTSRAGKTAGDVTGRLGKAGGEVTGGMGEGVGNTTKGVGEGLGNTTQGVSEGVGGLLGKQQ